MIVKGDWYSLMMPDRKLIGKHYDMIVLDDIEASSQELAENLILTDLEEAYCNVLNHNNFTPNTMLRDPECTQVACGSSAYDNTFNTDQICTAPIELKVHKEVFNKMVNRDRAREAYRNIIRQLIIATEYSSKYLTPRDVREIREAIHSILEEI